MSVKSRADQVGTQGDHQRPLQNRIAMNPSDAEDVLISYSLGVYYVHCSLFLKVPAPILDEIRLGFKEGISAFKTHGKPNYLLEEIQTMYDQIGYFGQEIYNDLNEYPPARCIVRPDAELVYKALLNIYNLDDLDVNPFDKILIHQQITLERVDTNIGIKQALKLGFVFQ